MKKNILVFLSFITGSIFQLQATFTLNQATNFIEAIKQAEKINSTLPPKIQAVKTAVRNYKGNKCKTPDGKKLSKQQCLAVVLSAISEALAAFTYPALGKFEDEDKLTPGMSVSLVMQFADTAKTSKQHQMYAGILKVTRELSGTIEALEVISFLLYPGQDTGNVSEPAKINMTDEQMAELDDELDDLDDDE